MLRSAEPIGLSDSPLQIFVRVLSSVSVISSFAVVTAGAAAENYSSFTLASSPPTGVIAELWIYNYKTKAFDETRYVVEPTTMKMAPPSHPPTDFESLRTERRRVNLETYNRLEQQLNELAASERDPVLVTGVQEIEKAKTWGRSPGDQLLISPDGHRVVLRPDMGMPVVVDLTTLHAQQLVKHSDSLDIPMAWSPDSRRLAFAPSEAREIVVYDVEQGVVESRLQGFWVQAIAWSPDMRTLALITLVNRRLYKTPKGLVAAWAGHPDFRNDLILEIQTIATQEQKFVPLKSNLDEQIPSDYWIEWH
jgi:WD40 repeat protein